MAVGCGSRNGAGSDTTSRSLPRALFRMEHLAGAKLNLTSTPEACEPWQAA